MTEITEIGPSIYRISTFVSAFDLQFNQFLVDDEEPLLYHAGLRGMFEPMHAAVAKVMDPARLRWIGFSHFEADECGALNEWLQAAPRAQAACSIPGARVNILDFASRPPRELADNEVFKTGERSFRFLATPHFPHGWDAGMLFEETTKTLFCSDILHQAGNGKALVESDLTGAFRETVRGMKQGPLHDYMPYSRKTEVHMARLAALNPETLAVMHGSSFQGDGAAALRAAGEILKNELS